MKGNGITNRSIIINTGKKQDQIIKKQRILGKIIKNRFDQPKFTNLLGSNLYLFTIPTTRPSLCFLCIYSRL